MLSSWLDKKIRTKRKIKLCPYANANARKKTGKEYFIAFQNTIDTSNMNRTLLQINSIRT